jgi:molybdopterin-guanine dinucleotide biosynthesis protein MobB
VIVKTQKVFGIVGWKNSGKTGLMERLIACFTSRGLVVSTLKHAHHEFDIDQPGRDSFRHRTAGASQVLLTSSKRWALMTELDSKEEPSMETLLAQLTPVDLVLVEGFKSADIPKLECYRKESDKGLLSEKDSSFLAIASDTDLPQAAQPVLDLDDTDAIADFIAASVGL